MKKLFTILFPFLFIFSFSFYQPIFHENGNESTISVLIDGVAKTSIPKKEDGYRFESISCNENSVGIWNNEKWSLKVSNLKNNRTKCNLSFRKIVVGEVWNFSQIDQEQNFFVPINGKYKIELWGSKGYEFWATLENSVGRGAYTSGEISLNLGESLYIYVGRPSLRSENFNGGGLGEAPGGGSTDVRLVNGNWNNFSSLKSRIMVASGGGGGLYKHPDILYEIYSRGDGGALNGLNSDVCISYSEEQKKDCKNLGKYGFGGYGASQNQGGAPGKESYLYPLSSEMTGTFGVGGYQKYYKDPVSEVINEHSSSGGGSGYYGGGHGTHPGSEWPGGGGGSSFISGYVGCNAISESSANSNIIHTNQPNHYSGKVFTNMVMKAGNESMPTHDGKSTMIGNSDTGYAKITFLGE